MSKLLKQIESNTISETKTENIFRKFYKTLTFIEKSAIPKKYGFKSKNEADTLHALLFKYNISFSEDLNDKIYILKMS